MQTAKAQTRSNCADGTSLTDLLDTVEHIYATPELLVLYLQNETSLEIELRCTLEFNDRAIPNRRSLTAVGKRQHTNGFPM